MISHSLSDLKTGPSMDHSSIIIGVSWQILNVNAIFKAIIYSCISYKNTYKNSKYKELKYMASYKMHNGKDMHKDNPLRPKKALF